MVKAAQKYNRITTVIDDARILCCGGTPGQGWVVIDRGSTCVVETLLRSHRSKSWRRRCRICNALTGMTLVRLKTGGLDGDLYKGGARVVENLVPSHNLDRASGSCCAATVWVRGWNAIVNSWGWQWHCRGIIVTTSTTMTSSSSAVTDYSESSAATIPSSGGVA